jgi:hypothetical protein
MRQQREKQEDQEEWTELEHRKRDCVEKGEQIITTLPGNRRGSAEGRRAIALVGLFPDASQFPFRNIRRAFDTISDIGKRF